MSKGRSYFDCVNIYPEDVHSIASDKALVRTSVVGFVVEYWNRTLGAVAASSAPLLFIDPSVVQAMVSFRDASIGPLQDMRRAAVVVFPITTHQGEGGQEDAGHWSLVVVVVSSRAPITVGDGTEQVNATPTFFCIDSSGRYNEVPSKHLVELLTSSESLGWGQRGATANGSLSNTHCLRYVRSFPQQETAYDCGVMVCLALQRMGETYVAGLAGRANTQCSGGEGDATAFLRNLHQKCARMMTDLFDHGTRDAWLWGIVTEGGGDTTTNVKDHGGAPARTSSVTVCAQEVRRDIVALMNATPFIPC
jgi:hypothetical protein